MKKITNNFNKLKISNSSKNKSSLNNNESNLKLNQTQKYNKVGYVYDEFMLKHKSVVEHCECPSRIEEIFNNLEKFKKKEELNEYLISLDSQEIDLNLLEKYIDVNYLNKLKNLENEESQEGSDTFFNQFTYKASLISSGCLIKCCDMILDNKTDQITPLIGTNNTKSSNEVDVRLKTNVKSEVKIIKDIDKNNIKYAFSITRPPGHHSDNKKSTGFCFLNNVYIATKYCQDSFGIKKVAIIDWDVHFGDGTYELLKNDPTILFISLHKFNDGYFYPGTGNLEKKGEGDGEFLKLNIPWNTRNMEKLSSGIKISDDEYFYAFEMLVIPMLKEFQPEIIFVSCGFDAAEGDTLGGLDLTPIGYSYMTKQ